MKHILKATVLDDVCVSSPLLPLNQVNQHLKL